MEFLYEVLWSYRMTTQTPTGETSFSLAFGFEAVISVEVGFVSFRVKHYNSGLNEEGLKLSLDLLQEKKG